MSQHFRAIESVRTGHSDCWQVKIFCGRASGNNATVRALFTFFASSHSASISARLDCCGAFPRAASARSIAEKRRSNFWLVCRNSASGSARDAAPD